MEVERDTLIEKLLAAGDLVEDAPTKPARGGASA
jgi:hypothetical protein